MKPKTIERPEEGGKLDEGKKLEESERPEESANSEQTGEAPKIRLFFQDDRKTRNHPVVQRERRHGKSPEVRIRKHHARSIRYFMSGIHSPARVTS